MSIKMMTNCVNKITIFYYIQRERNFCFGRGIFAGSCILYVCGGPGRPGDGWDDVLNESTRAPKWFFDALFIRAPPARRDLFVLLGAPVHQPVKPFLSPFYISSLWHCDTDRDTNQQEIFGLLEDEQNSVSTLGVHMSHFFLFSAFAKSIGNE